ncbi:MAG: hypothetical protein PHX27_03025 [Candidatus ainarchaeum sp.]|nr:hypothetical protein [Candidatus ainarchaeum sp.]
MSIYGPRLRLPKISLPNINIPKMNMKIIGIILILILVLATILFIFSTPLDFSQHILVNWRNNPLNLKENQAENAELNLTIINNTQQTHTIDLNVISESKEIIIFCPDTTFPNVAPNHKREITCLIKRNPKEKIFAGTYQININTNIGKTSTTLEIRR